jgi:membrane protease YdiL (CAAX protease family)
MKSWKDMALEELAPLSDEMKAKPWGFWATLGFSALIFAVFTGLQLVVMIVFLSFANAQHPEVDLVSYAKGLSSNGFWIAIATIVTGLICTPLTLWFAKLCKNISIKDYIGFREPSKNEWIRWLLILSAILFLSDGVSLLLRQPIVPSFMVDAYKTASFLPALLFAIIVVAPIFEEIFFRGFLFQGILHSRLGPIAAVGGTSLLWAAIHLQYDVYGMATIFLLGLLLGIARLRTDSIHLVMVMHSLVSLVATIETILYVHFNG